jgi:hypothetical protein
MMGKKILEEKNKLILVESFDDEEPTYGGE